MKQNPFLGLTTGIVIIAASVCITVSGENNTPKISDLMTKNLEALSRSEHADGRYYYVYYGEQETWIPELQRYVKATVLICEDPGNTECKKP